MICWNTRTRRTFARYVTPPILAQGLSRLCVVLYGRHTRAFVWRAATISLALHTSASTFYVVSGASILLGFHIVFASFGANLWFRVVRTGMVA